MKKYFIPIRLSLPLNWKLANLLAKASSAHTLWVPQHWRSRYFSYPGKWRYFGLQNATEQLSQEWTGPLPPTLCPDVLEHHKPATFKNEHFSCEKLLKCGYNLFYLLMCAHMKKCVPDLLSFIQFRMRGNYRIMPTKLTFACSFSQILLP